MAPKDEKVFDAFVRVWFEWWSGAPDRLARQESSLVVRLLTLGLQEGGIQQSELKRQLGIAQPRLSKLMEKLGKKKAGWIQVKRSETDRRVWLMTTTTAGEARLAALKADLAPLLRAQGAKADPGTCVTVQTGALPPWKADTGAGRAREVQASLVEIGTAPLVLSTCLVERSIVRA